MIRRRNRRAILNRSDARCKRPSVGADGPPCGAARRFGEGGIEGMKAPGRRRGPCPVDVDGRREQRRGEGAIRREAPQDRMFDRPRPVTLAQVAEHEVQVRCRERLDRHEALARNPDGRPGHMLLVDVVDVLAEAVEALAELGEALQRLGLDAAASAWPGNRHHGGKTYPRERCRAGRHQPCKHLPPTYSHLFHREEHSPGRRVSAIDVKPGSHRPAARSGSTGTDNPGLATNRVPVHSPAMRFILVAFIAALTLPAFAQDVPLPRPRPEAAKPVDETAPVPANPGVAEPDVTSVVPLPRHRPELKTEAAEDKKVTPPTAKLQVDAEAEEFRPPRIYQSACPALLLGQVEARPLPPIAENQCGERSPLSVTGVEANGRMIPFSGEATLNCGMATALPEWAAAVDNYLVARENTRIESIVVGTSYMCRPRNHVENADVSEHGFANGLDVVGFKLGDGRTVTLSEGWADALSPEGRLLRFAHDAGCSRFTTTLGPEANALHNDHLHLDLGCHGKTCTARLCE